jgi:uncharacterized protein
MIKTGIPQLDEMLGGGIEEGSTSALWIKPGLDGSPFAYQIANNAMKTKDVVYTVNSKNPKSIKEEMKSFGFDISKIKFVDAYSELIAPKKNSMNNVKNLGKTKIFESTINTAKKCKNPLIIIDSLSTAVDLLESEPEEIIDEINKIKGTKLFLFTVWEYDSKTLNNLKKSFDNIINITSMEKKLFVRQYFGVTKTKTGGEKKQAIPYRLMKPGGIKIYIPKILVIGPFNSGKTSFIHSASERSVSVDRLGTTIALDHGHVKYKNFTVDLFGTPGQERFDPILKLLGNEALGVIVVISATDPSAYPRALTMIKKANVYKLPYVIVANKSNLRGALKPNQIKTRIGLKDAEIIPVIAKDLTKVQPGMPCQLKDDSVKTVLKQLFNKILKA